LFGKKSKEAKQKPSELHPVFLLGDRVEREELQLNMLNIIFLLHYEFNPIPEGFHPEDTSRQLAQHFREAIIEHYSQSREVSFYARLFNLSPKYFSTLIKQVADQLGFSEQASFSRFFKNQTGLSPTEFRDGK